MDSRRRVETCFRHEEADRIPIDFGGWLSGIKRSAYDRLCAHLGVPPGGYGSYTPDETILRRFGVDFRRVTPGSPEGAARTNEDGSVTDEWGIARVWENEDRQIVRFPLKEATPKEIESYPWPDPDAPGRYEKVLKQAKAIHERGYAVSAQPDVAGVFELSCWLCDFDRILLEMAMDSEFIRALFEKITSLQERFAHRYYGTVGTEINMVQLGDDFGTQNAPFFSPEMYRDMIRPCQERYHAAIRRRTDAKLFHHSCGSVYRLLDQMVEAGVQILNPVQVSAAEMDPKRLKKEFGDVLVFHGGIDVQTVLPRAKPDEVRDEVKKIIDALAPGGGYVLAPSHNIQGDTPPENIVAMFETALEYGRYR